MKTKHHVQHKKPTHHSTTIWLFTVHNKKNQEEKKWGEENKNKRGPCVCERNLRAESERWQAAPSSNPF